MIMIMLLMGKREGEITIAEYSEAVGISYDKSKIELQEAERKGLMKCRKVGKRSYYSFP